MDSPPPTNFVRRRLPAAAVSIALGCAALMAGAPAAAAVQCPGMNATPKQVSTDELARATLCLLNAQRARHGAPALRANPDLTRAATRHSRDMERSKYFSHTSQNGANFMQRIRRTGYFRRAPSWTVAENLAWGAGDWRATPRSVVGAWMASPPHRANLLGSRYREVGIGVVSGAPRPVGRLTAATYTTLFGTRG